MTFHAFLSYLKIVGILLVDIEAKTMPIDLFYEIFDVLTNLIQLQDNRL